MPRSRKVSYLLDIFHYANVIAAFRMQMRTDTLALDSVARNDPAQVEEKIQLAKDLATTLRKNVVQATKGKTHSGEEAWSRSCIDLVPEIDH